MRPEEAAPAPNAGWTIEQLFEQLEGPLLNYTLRLTADREAAEDIVQEAFMRLHAQSEQVREPRRWLYRTSHNLALNYKRKAGKVVPLPTVNPESETTSDVTDPQPLPDEQIAKWEGIGLVRLCIETLDERQQELIRLKFSEGLSYKEMSQRTGLTVGHVGYSLHHALKDIAIELARNGVTR